jgi:hypothetical protein
MHSLPTDAELPIYGNKCIAMREGVIDLHGSVINQTWTKLNASIIVGATTLSVADSITEWKVNDWIVVASTDYDHEHSEKRQITNITGSMITVSEPFIFPHYSGSVTETMNG